MSSKRYIELPPSAEEFEKVNQFLTARNPQITGDDTPALQAVLDADVWRKHLLAEQEVRASVESFRQDRC